MHFDQDMLREKFDQLLHVSENLSKKGAEFVIWPEFTIPIYPLQNEYYRNRLLDFVPKHCPIFAGFTDLKSAQEIYNAVLLFKKEGIDQYNKVHLVPFGEYVPFKKILFFVEEITDEIGEFTPGEKIHNLNINNHLVATPICYELIYPELVRNFINQGGELIVILSNDSWYGKTATPYQLLSMSVFRSIENRRFILRSTTNGISALISPSGKIKHQIKLHTRGEFLAPFQYLSHKTIFTRIGYLFPYFCTSIVILFLFIRLRKNRAANKKKATS
jgi:apolipoprotein N-acyltransferase